MSQSLPVSHVADAAARFLAEVGHQTPSRVEAKVSSCNGMPLLCAVEGVLGRTLSRATVQELVWLTGAPSADAHVLHLRALGPRNTVLAEATLAFEG